ncbi:MAG: T9SS type A sorting domain-containing protein, partial [Parafilimonas sp.]
IALQKDGKIITGGYQFTDANNEHFLVNRYNIDGTIDSGFGDDGSEITKMNRTDAVNSIIIQKNGKIILIGSATSDITGSLEYQVALARYFGDSTKKQIIVQKIKHYLETHNAQASTITSNVFISPNPAQNNLHVTGLSANSKLTVVDFAGNVKLQAVSNNNSYNLNIASLQAGNYLLKIETKDAIITKQFVKE